MRLGYTALIVAVAALLAAAYYGGYGARANAAVAMEAAQEQLVEVGYKSGSIGDVNNWLENGWRIKAVYPRQSLDQKLVDTAMAVAFSKSTTFNVPIYDIQVYHLVKPK